MSLNAFGIAAIVVGLGWIHPGLGLAALGAVMAAMESFAALGSFLEHLDAAFVLVGKDELQDALHRAIDALTAEDGNEDP